MHDALGGCIRVLAYIKRAPSKGLIYQRHDHLHIEAYSDAGYAGDKGDQKSTTGYCTYVGGNLVTRRSQKQKVVSCSSAEDEYRAMAATTREMVWLQSFVQDLGITTLMPMPMHCDNKKISLLLETLPFTRGPSILRSIVTLFVTRC